MRVLLNGLLLLDLPFKSVVTSEDEFIEETVSSIGLRWFIGFSEHVSLIGKASGTGGGGIKLFKSLVFELANRFDTLSNSSPLKTIQLYKILQNINVIQNTNSFKIRSCDF